jgi:hypothetical protein
VLLASVGKERKSEGPQRVLLLKLENLIELRGNSNERSEKKIKRNRRLQNPVGKKE